MKRSDFERLVIEALDHLPKEFQEYLENVAFIIEDRPTARLLRSLGMEQDELLFGFYEGSPITDPFHEGEFQLPDKITLYMHTFELSCISHEEIVEEVRKTVLHEIGHHFGLEEDQLEEL